MMPRPLLLNHRITFASSSMYFVAVSDQQQHAVSQPPGRQDKQSCHQPTAQILPVTLVFVLDSITLSPETTRQVHVARYGKWGQTQVRLRSPCTDLHNHHHHPSQTNPPTSPQSQLGIPWRRTDVRGLSLVPKIGDSNRCIRCNGKTLQCKRALEI